MPGPDSDVTLPPDPSTTDETYVPSGDGAARIEPNQPANVGEYEIESEIARGGMGVVYKARHRSLNRTVALKMILTGQFASAEEVQRFHQEAAAAARLEHPGIVPVYEIGRHEGNHFFCMKFVEGVSLADRLGELRGDTRSAVVLIEQVARAVHFAHQRGILHRDLKPGNILIDGESGTPVVTDFGLAKEIGSDSKLTQSGAIVGTPAYMPPEQASGNEVTTGADIYSLGAILFELVTGSPPFRCGTALETLIAVVESERTPSPSDLNPSVNRDLEAIIVKALQREPAQRYASAAALANDLQAWLDDKPLSVKPPTIGSLLKVWFRENVRSVAGSLLVGSVAGLIVGFSVYYMFLARTVAVSSSVFEQLDVTTPVFARPMPFARRFSDGQGSAFITVLQYALMFGMAMVGFINAILVRPRDKGTAAASGLIVGLVVSIVGFASGVGWLVSNQNILRPHTDDIQLLAQGTWDGSGEAPGSAQRALLKRYPQLENVDGVERARLVGTLLRARQLSAIPVGLLGGMILMFSVGMLPSVLGTVLATSLLQSESSIFRAWLRYSQVVVAMSFAGFFLLLLVIGPMFGLPTYRPSVWLTALIVVVPAIAGALALRRASLVWGGVLLLASIVLAGLYGRQASVDYNGLSVAEEMVADGEAEEAARFLREQIAAFPETSRGRRLHLAALTLYLGQQDEYQKAADDFMHEYSGSHDQNELNYCALVSLIGPCEGIRLAETVELTDLLNPEWDNGYGCAFQITKALAKYRQRQPHAALKELESYDFERQTLTTAMAKALQVMSFAKLRSPELAAALNDLNRIPKQTLQNDGRWLWVMCFESLRSEAMLVVEQQNQL